MSNSSTSKTRTEHAGITDPTPSSPYARLNSLGCRCGVGQEGEGQGEGEGDSLAQKIKPALYECIFCIPWRDDESPPLPDTHAEQPLVPAGDDLGAGGQAEPGGQTRILPVPLPG